MTHSKTGSYNNYFWFQSEEIEKRYLLEKTSDFLRDKYLAVVTFDSGELILSSDDEKLGWKSVNGIAYSPILHNLEIIPYFEFDEWYFFNSYKQIEVTDHFVNYEYFDLANENMNKAFWVELENISPYAYIADGTILTCVTKDINLIDSLISRR